MRKWSLGLSLEHPQLIKKKLTIRINLHFGPSSGQAIKASLGLIFSSGLA